MYGLRVLSNVRLLVPNSSRNLNVLKYQSLLCSRAISTTCTLRFGQMQEEILTLAAEKNIPVEHVTRIQRTKSLDADVGSLEVEEFKFGETDGPSAEGQDQGQAPKLWVVLSEVGNSKLLGKMIRNFCCFGIHKIITHNCFSSGFLPHSTSYTSTGAAESVDIYRTENLNDFMQESKKRGKHVIGYVPKRMINVLDAEGATMTVESTPIQEAKLTKDSILIVMARGGLSEELLGLCDQLVTVPICPDESILSTIRLETLATSAIVAQHLLSPRQEQNKNEQ